MFNRKRLLSFFSPLILLVVISSLFVTPAFAKQPIITQQGIPANSIELDYKEAQSQSSLSDELKIKSAVDAYFNVKYQSNVKQEAIDPGFLINLIDEKGQDLYNYELGRSKFYIESTKNSNTFISQYSYRPEYTSIKIDGDSSTVIVKPWIDITYADTPGQNFEFGGETHTLTLVKIDNEWKLVSDSYVDEYTLSYPYGTDFEKLIKELPEKIKRYEDKAKQLVKQRLIDPRSRESRELKSNNQTTSEEITTQNFTASSTYRSYNRDNAAYYGKTYTNNNGDCSTTNYNSKFKNWASQCSDCQNFVSQCIWYGYGGSNTTTAINNHYKPMVYNISGATDWWCDSSSTGTNWTWTSVPHFESMIKANYTNDKIGVQGTEGTGSFLRKGDFISMKAYEHVYIVTDIVDSNSDGKVDFNEIYVSAHTNNRNNVKLSSLVSSAADVKFMYIMYYRES